MADDDHIGAAFRGDDSVLDAERARLAAERESRNQQERQKLSRLPVDAAAFRKAVHSFIDKGRE